MRRVLARLGSAVGIGALFAVLSGGTAIAPAAAHVALDDAVENPLIAASASLPGGSSPAGDAKAGAFRLTLFAPSASEARFDGPADVSREINLKPSFADDVTTAEGDDQVAPRTEEDLLRFGAVRVPRRLVQTILRAAEVTGVDPAYMMALADKESSFLSDVKASTSSAEGLFQFVEKTWLEVIRDFGPKHGFRGAASFVETVNGQLTIQNETIRQWVLGLRREPYVAAVMAAEMLKRDRERIQRRIGRDLDRSELYLMHFLGAESAGRLLELVNGKPKQSAPRVFPQAAKANKALFFVQEKRKLRHLTVAEVYSRIDRMIDRRLDRYEGVSAFLPVEATSLGSPL